jgi:hypothetical protein
MLATHAIGFLRGPGVASHQQPTHDWPRSGEKDGEYISVDLSLHRQHCIEDFAEKGRAERVGRGWLSRWDGAGIF